MPGRAGHFCSARNGRKRPRGLRPSTPGAGSSRRRLTACGAPLPQARRRNAQSGGCRREQPAVCASRRLSRPAGRGKSPRAARLGTQATANAASFHLPLKVQEKRRTGNGRTETRSVIVRSVYFFIKTTMRHMYFTIQSGKTARFSTRLCLFVERNLLKRSFFPLSLHSAVPPSWTRGCCAGSAVQRASRRAKRRGAPYGAEHTRWHPPS